MYFLLPIFSIYFFAGPIVLDAHEIGYMKYITSAAQYKKQLSEHYKYKESDIVVDG